MRSPPLPAARLAALLLCQPATAAERPMRQPLDMGAAPAAQTQVISIVLKLRNVAQLEGVAPGRQVVEGNMVPTFGRADPEGAGDHRHQRDGERRRGSGRCRQALC